MILFIPPIRLGVASPAAIPVYPAVSVLYVNPMNCQLTNDFASMQWDTKFANAPLGRIQDTIVPGCRLPAWSAERGHRRVALLAAMRGRLRMSVRLCARARCLIEIEVQLNIGWGISEITWHIHITTPVNSASQSLSIQEVKTRLSLTGFSSTQQNLLANAFWPSWLENWIISPECPITGIIW